MAEDLELSEAATGQLRGKELGRLKSKKAAMALQAKRKPKDSIGVPEDGPEVKRKKDGVDVPI